MFENGNPFRNIHSRSKLAIACILAFGLMLGTIIPVLNIPFFPSGLLQTAVADHKDDKGDKKKKFDIMEATIEDIQKAIKKKQVTSTEIVKMYLERIKAYNGVCVDQPEGILGPISPIANAGQINALMTLNLRPDAREEWGFDESKARSMTDPEDDDPNMPDALEVAADLDKYFKETGKLKGPLHGIPFAIKDQWDTFDMRTTSGSLADYDNDRPPDDSTVAERLRDAGAIILAKANMGEYAAGSRSSFGGQICNPYATDRDPSGSSGGSAASVAANLVTCAIAEESSGSVRGPANNNNVVGMVGTAGLLSRDGMIPAEFLRERPGPECKTVAEVATVLDALKGVDPRDPVTAESIGQIPDKPYAKFADAKSLDGMRIGVIREFMTTFSPAEEQTIELLEQAIEDLEDLGATIVDPGEGNSLFEDTTRQLVPLLEPEFMTRLTQTINPNNAGVTPNPILTYPITVGSETCTTPIDCAVMMSSNPDFFPSATSNEGIPISYFRMIQTIPSNSELKYMMNRYLLERNDANIETMTDLINEAQWFGTPAENPRRASLVSADARTNLDVIGEKHFIRRETLQLLVLKVMADNDLDALVYPQKTVPDVIIGEARHPTISNREARGWNSLTPMTGFPDIVVPAGFTTEVFDWDPEAGESVGPKPVAFPVSIDFIGRPWDEPTLLKIASAYEAATHHRTSPLDFGPLEED